ncbi:MAG: phospholipase [Paludibacter sp.]|nr:phospholipase [Paludibacter sp.]MDD4197986.1 phospholipase [Paludibacter sp.]MDD4427619.1 phospholipase [Paludibacter sp.]
MWVLIILLIAGAGLLMLFTYLNRRKKQEEVEITLQVDEECCGAHEVCQRDSLLNPDCEIVYYDDEELDQLSDTNPFSYTEFQRNQLADVFYTLKESDVAGWLRSLQLRKIELPEDIKDEALMIVRERRTI